MRSTGHVNQLLLASEPFAGFMICQHDKTFVMLTQSSECLVYKQTKKEITQITTKKETNVYIHICIYVYTHSVYICIFIYKYNYRKYIFMYICVIVFHLCLL